MHIINPFLKKVSDQLNITALYRKMNTLPPAAGLCVNLGAIADPLILGYILKNKTPFLMEVANRTISDKKGGHIAINKKNGQYILRESAQCHKDNVKDFQNITKHKYFNTNNIWINLEILKNVLKKNNNVLPLPLIRNSKPINPSDKNCQTMVYQLETAQGAAIELFEGAKPLLVPKKRFVPVKKCSELLNLWSDIYILTDDHRMIVNPERKSPPINIKLDHYYDLIKDFEQKFKIIPSLVNCKELSVTGDILFKENLIFTGTIEIINNSEKQIELKDLNIKDTRIIIDKNKKMSMEKLL